MHGGKKEPKPFLQKKLGFFGDGLVRVAYAAIVFLNWLFLGVFCEVNQVEIRPKNSAVNRSLVVAFSSTVIELILGNLLAHFSSKLFRLIAFFSPPILP